MQNDKFMNVSRFTYIDLFSGIGGFHQAMSSLGGECVWACDIDANCRQTYFDNYKLMPAGDITLIAETDIPPHDVLCAGFPCQAFSKAGNRLGFGDQTKGTLFFDILRIAKYHKPKYILLENVRNLASHDKGHTWQTIYTQLVNAGYNLLPKPIIFSPHYIGIPQHRERVFIMCTRDDLEPIPPFFVNKTQLHKCFIDSVLQDENDIQNLNKYMLNKDIIKLIDIWNEFLQNIKGPPPGFPIWSEWLRRLNPNENINVYPKWKQNFILKNNKLYIDNQDFINDWLPRARSLPNFFGAKAKLEWQAGTRTKPNLWHTIMHFRPSGIRCKEATYFPALVAITQTSIIGKRKRFLTPRECARLQSFPDSFQYDKKDAQAYKQLGNSVNVETVKIFAKFMFGDKQTRKQFTNKT